jgi:VWFA-related protein
MERGRDRQQCILVFVFELRVGMAKLIAGLLASCCCWIVVADAQQQPSAGQPPVTGQSDPTLAQRPPAPPPGQRGAVTPEGSMHLDVRVTDRAGKPITGLGPQDFTLLDENKPRKILSFRSYDGVQVKANPPVEVILLVDALNGGLTQLGMAREQIQQFLTANGGHLAQPVTLMLLTEAGLRVQPRSSTDGNALVTVLNQITASVHTLSSAMGTDAQVERFQRSAKALALIADNESKRPGRKLLVWVGPGWPQLQAEVFLYSKRNQEMNFDSIVSILTRLREGRLEIFSVGGGAEYYFQDHLKPVRTDAQANPPNLSLQVLAVESGGMTIDPGNVTGVAGQLSRIVESAGAFYTISFDPPAAEHPNEYHELKVQVDQPGVTARTIAGYYDQPK